MFSLALLPLNRLLRPVLYHIRSLPRLACYTCCRCDSVFFVIVPVDQNIPEVNSVLLCARLLCLTSPTSNFTAPPEENGMPNASCGSASDLFTCSAGVSFWGCCKSNPCAATPPSTCAQGDLVPAFMERPEQFSVYASTSVTPESLSSDSSSGETNNGAIVGGVVGGVVALAIIGLVVFFVLRRKRSEKPAGGHMDAAAMIPMTSNEKGDQGGASVQFGVASPTRHQYSELPADASSGMDTRRFSELLAESTGPSELESPYVSPMSIQEEFSDDMAKRASRAQALGLSTGDSVRRA